VLYELKSENMRPIDKSTHQSSFRRLKSISLFEILIDPLSCRQMHLQQQHIYIRIVTGPHHSSIHDAMKKSIQQLNVKISILLRIACSVQTSIYKRTGIK
jgi:hypothetical protein